MRFGEEKTIDELEQEGEQLDRQLSVAQKRALLKEAKKRYGKDWKLHLPNLNIKSGMDWNSLRFKL